MPRKTQIKRSDSAEFKQAVLASDTLPLPEPSSDIRTAAQREHFDMLMRQFAPQDIRNDPFMIKLLEECAIMWCMLRDATLTLAAEGPLLVTARGTYTNPLVGIRRSHQGAYSHLLNMAGINIKGIHAMYAQRAGAAKAVIENSEDHSSEEALFASIPTKAPSFDDLYN